MEDVEKLASFNLAPVETARNITYIYSDSAIIRAKLVSPLMEKYLSDKGEYYYELKKGVNITFFDVHQNENGFLTADYGVHYPDRKIMIARGNVMVVNKLGDTLNTDELIWDEKAEKIYSEKFVSVKTSEQIIKSQGFETDPSFTRYKFKNIKGVISLQETE